MEGINRYRPRVLLAAFSVADINRSLEFYIGALGMRERYRVPLGGSVQEVVLGFPESEGNGVILMWDTNRQSPYQIGDGYSRLVLSVTDVNAVVKYLTEKCVTVVKGPVAAGPVVFALIRDPDGYAIELMQLKVPAGK
jgi:lactoylglutathione lyase